MTATASSRAHRDATTGRYSRPDPPCCGKCGWTLAESLAAWTYCPNQKCSAYRTKAGRVSGVNIGRLGNVLPAAIERP